MEGVSIRLRETISSLWERLEIPQTERELFNRQHQGYKPKVIAAVSEYFDTFHWGCVLHCHDNIQQPNKGIVSSIIP